VEREGEADGLIEDEAEGEAEGESEGEADSEGIPPDSDGLIEGLALGLILGLAEGEAEGLTEGLADKLTEGEAEGEADGDFEFMEPSQIDSIWSAVKAVPFIRKTSSREPVTKLAFEPVLFQQPTLTLLVALKTEALVQAADCASPPSV
jgi:hypothetical protein